MTIVRPNLTQEPSGARFVLKKYLNWKKEFATFGSVDFKAVTPWSDSDGHEWTIVNAAASVAFELTAGGVYISMAAAASSFMRVYTRDLISGLDPMDKLWIIWKATNFNGFANTGACMEASWKRNTTHDGGAAWRQQTPGGVQQYGIGVWSDGLFYPYYLGPSSAVDRYFSINGSGMTFQYRQQLASVDFPSIPEPYEIPLFTSASQDGTLGANIDGTGNNPNVKDVDLTEDNIRFGLFASGVGAHNVTWEELWVYRYE